MSNERFQPVDSIASSLGAASTFMGLPQVSDASQVDIALVGVPWDGGTTNRAGARHGPREIRNMSSLVRRVHHVSRVSPYDLCRVGDLGDARVNPVDLDDTLARVEGFYRELRERGATPLSAGGDHLVTLPILRGIHRGRPAGLVHFDAHSNTNDHYFGAHKYTHGTPFRRAVEEELVDPERTIQIGIRGSLYSSRDLAFAEQSGMRIVYIEEYFQRGAEAVAAEARRVAGGGPVYVSFDVAALDPAYAPGTSTPEAGGYSTFEAQQMIRGLQGLDVVGGDVVEVSPPFDPSGNTALVGATLMFELLCVLADAVARGHAA